MANHFRLDLDLVELLAGVDANDASNHLGDDNHVSEVGLDEVGLLVGLGLLLGLSELLDEAHGAALQAAVDPSAGTGVDDISELVRGEVEEAVWFFMSAPLFSRYRIDVAVAIFVVMEDERRMKRTCQGRFLGKRTCGRFFSS